jgi:hypothetical protein
VVTRRFWAAILAPPPEAKVLKGTPVAVVVRFVVFPATVLPLFIPLITKLNVWFTVLAVAV